MSSAGWKLVSVTVKDFRGVLGSQQFTFDQRSVLLAGENGVGKSTVALALEWILFGCFPSGSLAAPKASFLSPIGSEEAYAGEVVFRRGAESLSVSRTSDPDECSVRYRSKTYAGDKAAAALEKALGLDLETFVRAVLLQQGNIRGLLLDEPKARNKALDRLLGMEAAETILETVKPRQFTEAAAAWREHIEETEARMKSQAEVLEERFKAAQQDARTHKFLNKDLNLPGLRNQWSELSRRVVEVAKKYGVTPQQLPEVSSAAEAKKASQQLVKILSTIRVSAEVSTQLAPVQAKIAALQAFLERWEELQEEQKGEREAVDQLEKKHGNKPAVLERLEKLKREADAAAAELRGANELRALLTDARSYVSQHTDDGCPVCESPIADQKALQRRLGERVAKLTDDNVKAHEKRQSQIDSALKGLTEHSKNLAAALELLKRVQANVETERKKAMKLLGTEGLMEKTVKPTVEKAITAEEKRRAELTKGVASMENDLSAVTDLDGSIRDGLVPFIEARQALEAHEKKHEAEKKKYASSEKKAAALDASALDVDKIRKAVLAAKTAIASASLDKARPRAQLLYERLVRHKLFDRLEVKTVTRANKVDYSFEVASSRFAKSGREARLVLSDGQLTAAALALFYALAQAAQHELDFLYVDDPTQNLDHAHKEAMAKVICELADQKQIILSTQDEDFVTLLQDRGFAEKGLVLQLHDWDRKPRVSTSAEAVA